MIYLQGVQGYLAPPIFVVFFLGVFMKRLNGKGCLAALLVGFRPGRVPPGGRHAGDTLDRLGGLPRTAMRKDRSCGSSTTSTSSTTACLIFLVCVVVMVAVSYVTPAPDEEKISGLTYGTITAEHRRVSRSSWDAARCAGLGLGVGLDSCGLPVFHRVAPSPLPLTAQPALMFA